MGDRIRISRTTKEEGLLTAVIPISTFFELLFAFFALLLWKGSINLERICAVGFLIFEIPLITLPQQFYVESSGTVTLSTLAFPAPILGYVIFGIVLLIIIAAYRSFQLYSVKDQK